MNRQSGAGMRKPYIVAELGANHGGRIERMLALVECAARAGADAVKLQCWTPGSMVNDAGYVMKSGPWQGRNLAALYEEAHTPWRWFPMLFDRAKSLGIEAFASVFDTNALIYLETIDCPRYKVSSFEIVDLRLIRAIAATGKPIIISTGMATADEINRAVGSCHHTEGGNEKLNDLTLLKCTSAYPAPIEDANLACMMGWQRIYHQIKVGLSDHTEGWLVAIAATALGATIIEKHLTLSREDGGPDAGFSMEPDQFAAMVTACRQTALAIGTPRYGPTEAELPMLEVRRVRSAHRVPRETMG